MQHKTALITGASSGIGYEFALQLHQQGFNLILVARRADRLNQLSNDLNSKRASSAEVVICDLASTQLRDLEKIIETRTIDLLVSNAGRGSFGRFETLSRDQETEMVSLNLVAPLRLMHAVIPQMKQRRSGAIISVSSIAAFQPLPYMSTYAATKAFNFTHALGLRHELKEFGITVTALCPGPTETEFGGVARVPGEWTGGHRDQARLVVAESLSALKRDSSWTTPCLRSKLLALASRITPVDIATRAARRALLGALRWKENGVSQSQG